MPKPEGERARESGPRGNGLPLAVTWSWKLNRNQATTYRAVGRAPPIGVAPSSDAATDATGDASVPD
jgi:hypothetical protein